MSACPIQLSACNATLANLTAQVDSLEANCSNYCEANVTNQCVSDTTANFNQAYHIGAVFVILVASAVGCGLPVVSLYVPCARINPYIIVLGKCTGIGVVLSCALIHMLQPGAESLTSPCVPSEFNSGYSAYAFLFAMLCGLLMQFLDYHVVLYVSSRLNKKKLCEGHTLEGNEEAPEHNHHAESHGHSHEALHAMALDTTQLKAVEAYMLEFAVTVHSIFIGMTLGIADDSALNALLPALVFHQFFEGVALGSRLADAKFGNHFQVSVLILIFSVSAPVGITIGLVTRATANLNGSTFLLVQGTFDSCCGGILLYIGYSLLLKDFPEDMERHCSGKKSLLRRYAMFIALWIGAGVMSFIGKYL